MNNIEYNFDRTCVICKTRLTGMQRKTCSVECRKSYAKQYQMEIYSAAKVAKTKISDIKETVDMSLTEYKSRGLTLNRILIQNCEIDFFAKENVCILCTSKPQEKSMFCSDTCRKRFISLASRSKKNEMSVYVRKNTQIVVNLDKDFEAVIFKYNEYEKQRNAF